MKAVIGVSDDIDVEVAVQNVIDSCRDQLENQAPQVGILLTSLMGADFSAMQSQVRASFPELDLIGCTTDGEITLTAGFSEDSIALLLLSSDEIRLATGVARDISKNPRSSMMAGFAEASEKLGTDPICAVVLPDGLSTMNISLDESFIAVLGETFPIFGGTAGDHFLLEKTYQFYNGEVLSDAMPILLFGGEIDIAASVFTGPVPFGPSYTIDGVDRNRVSSIDGKTTLAFYEQHLGEFVTEFANFPLAVYPDDSEDFYLRDPVEVNKEDGSILFLGTLPENCTVRLTQVSREDILLSAEKASRKVLSDLGGGRPELVLVFSCTSRKHILGSQADGEFSVLRTDRRRIPIFGFYCYGEISPFSVGLPTRFHSDTFVAAAFRSRISDGK